VEERGTLDAASPAGAVLQLLAIGPGAGDKNAECAATGVLVSEQGYILTNAHVVADARRCLAGGPEAKIMAKFAALDSRSATAVSCDLVGVDDLHDLALMKAERPPPAGEEYPFVLLGLGEVAVGTPVAVTGHPAFAWQPHTQTGKVVRREFLQLSKESAEGSEVIVVDIPLKTGSSGSPVYLQGGGAVVGIVERQNTANRSETVAVPIRYAIELLDRHGVRWHRGMW